MSWAKANSAVSSITTMRRRAGSRVDERQDAVDVLLVLGDEQHGAAVAHLVLDLLGRGRRIDAVDDGAERLGGEIADQPFLAGVRHDGDALAGPEAQRREGLGGARHHRARSRAQVALAIDAERLGAEGDRARARAAPAPAAAPAPWCGAARRPERSVRRSGVIARSLDRHARHACGRCRRGGRPLGDQLGEARRAIAAACPRPWSAGRQLITALHMPSTASMASRASMSPRDAAVGDAGQDHVLEAALDAPRLAADAPPAGGRQIAPLVDEHLDVVAPGLDRAPDARRSVARACRAASPALATIASAPRRSRRRRARTRAPAPPPWRGSSSRGSPGACRARRRWPASRCRDSRARRTRARPHR